VKEEIGISSDRPGKGKKRPRIGWPRSLEALSVLNSPRTSGVLVKGRRR